MELQFFKDNFYDAVYQHSRKLFWPSMAITIITSLMMLITLVPLFFNLFPEEVRTKMMSLPQSMEDMAANSKVMEGFVKDYLSEFIVLYFAVLVIVLLIWSYGLRIGYAVSKRQLEGDYTWGQLLFGLFDRKLLQLLGFSFLMMLFGIAALMLASSIGRMGVLLFLTAILILLTYLLRFTLAAPAIIIADMDIREAMRYSVKNMTWSKAFKLFFFIFVVAIAAGVTAVILSLLVGLILGDGLAGTLVSNFILLFVNASVYALLIAGSAGLLYRYGNFEEPNEIENREDQVSLNEP